MEYGENQEGVLPGKPYPEVCVRGEDPYFAQLLMVPYAGRTSELTSICTYSYQSVLFGGCAKGVRNVLTRIAMEEMTHFSLLARMIVLLGGDPCVGVCSRGSYIYWAGSNTNTEKSFGKALRQDIADEEHTASEYALLAKKICDPGVAAVLERMRQDEEAHVCLLQRLAEESGT